MSEVDVQAFEEMSQPPHAAAIVESLRAIGYSFNTAIADIIDNSITAKARNVQISFQPDPAYVAILDDGVGMSRRELLDAMRHGGVGPTERRDPNDLGRYGLGLKTASFSQCRRLTVVSKKHGEISAACWDLDEIKRRNDWTLLVLRHAAIASLPEIDQLTPRPSGTIVIWEKLDRATAGESRPGAALQKAVVESSDYLGLVFHRYLSPEHGKRLNISVNRRAIDAADPFMQSNPFTELVGDEKREIDGHNVHVKAYILPHFSKMTAEELRYGKDNLRDSQGFYVYRNRRLITWGTWFKLISKNELTRLARIQVDIPNAFDDLWSLDIKKSTATPPERIRHLFLQIVETVANRSVNVFQDRRRRRADSREVTYLWERTTARDGVKYLINRGHPLLKAFADQLSRQQLVSFNRIVDAIEISIPVRSIHVDQASNTSAEPMESEAEAVLPLILQEMLSALTGDDERQALLATIAHIEPFRTYPNITRTLLESKSVC